MNFHIMKIAISKEKKIYILLFLFFLFGSYIGFAQVGIGTTNPMSTFEVNGSFGQKLTIISTSTTLDETHNIITYTNNDSAGTITLPTAVGITGRIYTIKRAGNAEVVIAATLSETIDGQSTHALATAKGAVEVVSDGANWQVISKF